MIFYIQNKMLYFVKHPWKAEAFNCSVAEIKKFSDKYGYFSAEKPLIGKVSTQEEDIQIVQKLLEVVHDKIKNPKKRLLSCSEIITKVLAYRDLKEGMQISIPVIDKNGKECFARYVVDKVFNIWQEMPAFGLLPLNLSSKKVAPMLIFRGTDFSFATKRSRFSIISDFDMRGPGFYAFFNAKPDIHAWLKKAYKSTGIKTSVLGFSLGGALTSYTLLFERPLVSFDKYQPSVAFNPPGVIRKFYIRWNKLTKENKPAYLVFVTENDIVSKYGRLLGDVYRLVPSKTMTPVHAHVSLVIAQNKYHLCPIEKY